jgi:hypothetical protein
MTSCGMSSISELPMDAHSSMWIHEMSPTNRFSSYSPPTDAWNCCSRTANGAWMEPSRALLDTSARYFFILSWFHSALKSIQVYVVSVFDGYSSIPCVYMLLPDKSQETYDRAFRKFLKNVYEDHPERFDPVSVMAGWFLSYMNHVH